MEKTELLVIGGGSAGMKAARTAAAMGRKVTLCEERGLGGECFWGGCVPAKAMVRAAEVWNTVRNAAGFGIHAPVRKKSFAGAMEYRDRVVREVGGDGSDDGGLSKAGVKYLRGHAEMCDSHVVQINSELVHADRILIATGTLPVTPPIPGLENVGCLTNREAVLLNELPKSLVIIGGGPVGLEFAQVFRRFGAEVTIVEMASRILPQEDGQISELAVGFLREEGIHIFTDSKVIEVSKYRNRKRLKIVSGDTETYLSAHEILIAAGRSAAIGNLGLEAAGVEFNERVVRVDDMLRTTAPHIYAAGDVCGGYLFTHVASFEGELAARNAFSENPEEYNPRVVPRATYIDPEVASIGITLATAQWEGIDAVESVAYFSHVDRAILYGAPRGIVKIVSVRGTGEILGAHMVGHSASSLLPEVALAMQNHLPLSAIAHTMHAYPTFSEAVEAAALGNTGH